MLTILIIVALFIMFDIIALRWSVDTTDDVMSCEWSRRWHQYDDVKMS